MSIETFDPSVQPSYPMPTRTTANVLQISFGDGYSQRTADGLNAIKDVVSVVWDMIDLDPKNEIVDFFVSHAGYKAFLWTPPGGDTEKKWICKQWGVDPVPTDLFTVTAEIEEVFDLDD